MGLFGEDDQPKIISDGLDYKYTENLLPKTFKYVEECVYFKNEDDCPFVEYIDALVKRYHYGWGHFEYIHADISKGERCFRAYNVAGYRLYLRAEEMRINPSLRELAESFIPGLKQIFTSLDSWARICHVKYYITKAYFYRTHPNFYGKLKEPNQNDYRYPHPSYIDFIIKPKSTQKG